MLHPNNHTRGLKITSTQTVAVGDTETYNAIGGGYGQHIFQTDSIERLRIDSSGRVGIGTSSPNSQSKLTLQLPSGTNGRILTMARSAGSYAYHLGVDASSKFTLYNNDGTSSLIAVDSSGNVGIGTNSPESRLSVLQSAVDGNALVLPMASGATDENFTSIRGKYSVGNEYTRGEVRFGVESFAIGSGFLAFATGTNTATERMRIDASGKVGIGTTSPNQLLSLNSTAAGERGISFDQAGVERVKLLYTNSSGAFVINNTTAGYTSFENNGAERMRIDSSGNLLVGKTGTNFNAVGIELHSADQIYATSTTHGLAVNRLSTDGDIAKFYKDGTTVGSIGTVGGELYIESGDVGLQFNASGNNIVPYANGFQDAVTSIGASSNRFKDLYLSGGVYLGGTGAANKLDDYETGTWTPVYQSVTNPSGVTYDSGATYGSYTKVGNLVTVVGRIRTDGITDVGSGDLRIGGLPFTVSSSVYAPANLAISNAFASNNPITGYGNVGSTYISLMYRSSITGQDENSQCSDLGVGGNDNSVAFSMSYIV